MTVIVMLQENHLPDLLKRVQNGASASGRRFDKGRGLLPDFEDSAGWGSFLEESFQSIPFSPPGVGNPEPAQSSAVEAQAPARPNLSESTPQVAEVQTAATGDRKTAPSAAAAVPKTPALQARTSKAAARVERHKQQPKQKRKQAPLSSGQRAGTVAITKVRKHSTDGGVSMRERQLSAQVGSSRRSASPLKNGFVKKRTGSAANLTSLAHDTPSSAVGKPPTVPKKLGLVQLEEDDPFREYPSTSTRLPHARGGLGESSHKPAAAPGRCKTPGVAGTAVRNGSMTDILDRSQPVRAETVDRSKQVLPRDEGKRRAAPRPNPGSEQAARAIDQIKAARDAKQSKHVAPTAGLGDVPVSKPQPARLEALRVSRSPPSPIAGSFFQLLCLTVYV